MPEAISNSASFFAGFLQFDVLSADLDKNLSTVSRGLKEIAAAHPRITPGIIVLPELWATGFAYDRLPELAGRLPELLQGLQELAARYRIHIAGSLPEILNGRYYNTLYITGPEGSAGLYRKQRLFNPMGEDAFFTPGSAPCPVQTSLGPVACLVCYDLRFPELLREQTKLGADLLVVPAQWPAARINHWRILIQARAVENQMYVVAANRCGTTDDTTFGGHSMIVAPDGAILREAGAQEEFSGVMLDSAMVDDARSLFRTLLDTQ